MLSRAPRARRRIPARPSTRPTAGPWPVLSRAPDILAFASSSSIPCLALPREDPRGPERTRPACAHQHPPLPPPCSRSPFIPPPPALASPSGPAHLRRPARAPGPPEAGPARSRARLLRARRYRNAAKRPTPPPLPEHQGRAALARPSEHPFPYTAPPAARPLPATPAGPARALARDNPSSPHPHSLRPVLPTSQQADKPTSRQADKPTSWRAHQPPAAPLPPRPAPSARHLTPPEHQHLARPVSRTPAYLARPTGLPRVNQETHPLARPPPSPPPLSRAPSPGASPARLIHQPPYRYTSSPFLTPPHRAPAPGESSTCPPGCRHPPSHVRRFTPG